MRVAFDYSHSTRTRTYGEAAINLMMELYPLMGTRRKEQIMRAFQNCEKVTRILAG